MSSIKEQYQIGRIMKLIDLNKDATNFEMNFQVVAENNAEFEIVIVDQDTLDEGNLEYKKVQGAINGNIRNDKNIYQSYMMALRADKPCNVTVETNFTKLPDNIPQPGVPEPESHHPPQVSEKKSNIPWKYIFIGIVVIIGLALLYYFYMYGGGNGTDKGSLNDGGGVDNIRSGVQQETFMPSTDNSVVDIGTNEIFAKLRNLPLR